MYQLIELDDMVWAMQYENTGVERTHWKIVDFSDGSSIILSPEIRLLRSFPDNYIEYTMSGSSSYNRKGIMTCTGESIIEPEYDYIEKSGDFFSWKRVLNGLRIHRIRKQKLRNGYAAANDYEWGTAYDKMGGIKIIMAISS